MQIVGPSGTNARMECSVSTIIQSIERGRDLIVMCIDNKPTDHHREAMTAAVLFGLEGRGQIVNRA